MGTVRDDIVFLLDRQADRRCRCKSALAEAGFVPVGFEGPAILADNAASIRPKAVILGAMAEVELARVLYALYGMDQPPTVFFLDEGAYVTRLVDSHVIERMVVLLDNPPMSKVAALIKEGAKSVDRQDSALPVLVGTDSRIQKIRSIVDQIADLKDSVFICGEEGTGKELVARLLHLKSNRRHLPVIRIQCDEVAVAMPAMALYQALTDGRTSRASVGGIGTIIIGKINRLPAEHQVQLLRALEVVAESHEHPELRIVATSDATNKMGGNLPVRGDLYYRLNVIAFDMPPLRHRTSDLGLLLAYFSDFKGLSDGKEIKAGFGEITDQLLQYEWPGNVAEFQEVVHQWVDHNWEPAFFGKHLKQSDAIRKTGAAATGSVPSIKGAIRALKGQSLKEVCRPFAEMTERRLMALALEKARGNRKKAAAILRISYKSLLNKVKEYELN